MLRYKKKGSPLPFFIITSLNYNKRKIILLQPESHDKEQRNGTVGICR